MQDYKYGYATNALLSNSYNYEVGIGGVYDGESQQVIGVSNNLDNIEQHIITQELEIGDVALTADRNHEYVNYIVDELGGKVVSVMIDKQDSDNVYYVIFENPSLPIVI